LKESRAMIACYQTGLGPTIVNTERLSSGKTAADMSSRSEGSRPSLEPNTVGRKRECPTQGDLVAPARSAGERRSRRDGSSARGFEDGARTVRDALTGSEQGLFAA